jgi:hypothetical protein
MIILSDFLVDTDENRDKIDRKLDHQHSDSSFELKVQCIYI